MTGARIGFSAIDGMVVAQRPSTLAWGLLLYLATLAGCDIYRKGILVSQSTYSRWSLGSGRAGSVREPCLPAGPLQLLCRVRPFEVRMSMFAYASTGAQHLHQMVVCFGCNRSHSHISSLVRKQGRVSLQAGRCPRLSQVESRCRWSRSSRTGSSLQ